MTTDIKPPHFSQPPPSVIERGHSALLPRSLAANFVSQLTTVRGVGLHHVDGGAGPAVLLVCGWPQTWYTWREIMPLLVAAGLSVVAVDPRGIGSSDIVASDDLGSGYDMTTISNELVSLMQALGHHRFSIVGHDIGMWIAYAMAADHPERIERLAVADAMIPGLTPSPLLFCPAARINRSWHFAFNRAPTAIQEALLSGSGARAYLEWQFMTKASHPGAVDPNAVEQFVQAYLPPARLRAGFDYYRAIETTIAGNERRNTRQIEIPVLALAGEMAAGRGVASTMERVCSNVEGHSLAGVGHYVTEEAPFKVAELLCAFLTG
jgi:pimeloyl-ACP methyl ester carboxylesterase